MIQRTGEIGIRIALGARAKQVLTGVLCEALWMALAGVTVGIGLSFSLARFVGAMLYGLRPTNPIAAGGTVGVLVCITLLAGIGPARRASRVNPLGGLAA